MASEVQVQILRVTLSSIVGRGGGQEVSVLAFYSDDLCSNPAEAFSFSGIRGSSANQLKIMVILLQ